MPNTSTRKVATENEVQPSVYNFLKKHRFHSYKVLYVQERFHEDFDQRIEFCELIEARGYDFVNNIVFFEVSFELHGNINRQNFRYWSIENLRWIRDNKFQYPDKVNVWAERIGDHLIGLFFIDGNLNFEMCETMLIEQIIPAIRNLFSNDFDRVWFQQDGVPAHFGLRVQRLLDETFANRWIGRRGTIEWLSRSSDLTLLDFFLWEFLKERVYKTKSASVEELKQRITDEISLMTVDMLKNISDSFFSIKASTLSSSVLKVYLIPKVLSNNQIK